MRLAELAQVSGVSAATIKFYRREGLLPPGDRLTATRADYGQRHLDRLRLVTALRQTLDTPVAQIAVLTAAIDDPEVPMLAVLRLAQAIAAGLPAQAEDPAEGLADQPAEHVDEDPRVTALCARLGWPDRPSLPRAALTSLLREMQSTRSPIDERVLARYARAMDELARGDLEALRQRPLDADRPPGSTDAVGSGAQPSADVVVLRAITGMVAYERLASILRSLAYTSRSMALGGAVDPAGGTPASGTPASSDREGTPERRLESRATRGAGDTG